MQGARERRFEEVCRKALSMLSKSVFSSSSQSLNFFGTGKPVTWLSHQKRLGQDEIS